ncbi:MAG: CinA family nicotinamide mononucleotide deamidase-related protein [Bacteroidales bacterium]
MNVSILTIGDEILNGYIVDTNSAWIAQEINSLGLELVQILTVNDNISNIETAIRQLFGISDVVIVTGGLGPTSDDLTVEAVGKYLGRNLVLNNEALRDMENILSNKNIPLTETNKKQAYLPEGCSPIRNMCGTAPGVFYQGNNKLLFVMPGVPGEMKMMMKNFVVPKLSGLSENIINNVYIHTFDTPESLLFDIVKPFEKELPKNIKLAYLPNYGKVTLRLTEIINQNEATNSKADFYSENLKELLIKNKVLISEHKTWEAYLAELLTKQDLTLATAESCTGGAIAKAITSVSGASVFFKGSVVAYSNSIKQSILNVPASVLDEYGAVSEQTVTYMAKGVKEKFNTDCAIAVSGIAGPTGATNTRKVGDIWIAVAIGNKIIAKLFHFNGNRDANIEMGTNTALRMMIQNLQSK